MKDMMWFSLHNHKVHTFKKMSNLEIVKAKFNGLIENNGGWPWEKKKKKYIEVVVK